MSMRDCGSGRDNPPACSMYFMWPSGKMMLGLWHLLAREMVEDDGKEI